MNILYIANSTSMTGGDNRSLLTLLREVRSMGINPFVLTPDRNGLYVVLKNEGFFVDAVTYKMDIYPNLFSLKDCCLFVPRLICRRLIEWKAEKIIQQKCKEWNIDLVHSNTSVLSCGLYAAMKKKLPHITHVREYVDKDFHMHPYPNFRSYYKRLQFPGSYVICITKGIQKHHKLEGENVEQIYNGIAVDFSCQQSEFYQKERYFFFAGRIEKAKGVKQLLEAYAKFISENPEGYALKLAGEMRESCYLAELQDYILKQGLTDKVQFLGPRKDVSTLMRDAEAVIVTSEFEGFGRCLPEAMLNRTLTIGRNNSGTKEQFDNGLSMTGNEIGLRYSTTSELVSRLIEVYNWNKGEDGRERSKNMRSYGDYYRFSDMIDRAQIVVANLYSPEKYVQRVVSFYERILNKHTQDKRSKN